MRILRIIETIDLRRGGPINGLRAIGPHLRQLGIETEFLCLDDPMALLRGSMSGESFVHSLGPVRPGYGYTPAMIPWLRENARRFDAVFVHGLWQYAGRAAQKVLPGEGVPYFVMPHGMLDPWFKRAYPLKHLKKALYWRLVEHAVLRDARAVIFTCERERELAAQTFRPYRCNPRVISYGTAGPPPVETPVEKSLRDRLPAMTAAPFWLYLGRVHAKKGVDLLLRAYGRIAASLPAGQTLPQLVIAGPLDDAACAKQLREIQAELPPACRVHWAGMLVGEAKWNALREAEAFVLPSHQENFGLAVVEAMSVGLPVLISDQINIHSEISASGAGIVEPDTLEGTERLLRRWMKLPDAGRRAMRAAAERAFNERYEIRRVAASVAAMLSELVPSPSHAPAQR